MRAKICMLAVMIGVCAAAPLSAEIKIFNGKSGSVTIIDGNQPKAAAKPLPAPQQAPSPSLQPPPVPTVRREGAVTITTEPDPSSMPSGGGQDGGQAACQTPKASVKVNYGKEDLVYDIDNSEAFREQKKIVSDFSLDRSIDFQESASGQCLDELTVVINVTPAIHLPAHLAVDGSGCKRLAQIEREQSFSAATAAKYQDLAGNFEQAARQALSAAKNQNQAGAVKTLKTELEALLADFDDAQAKRRASFKAADIPVTYFDDCRESKAKTDVQPLKVLSPASGNASAPPKSR